MDLTTELDSTKGRPLRMRKVTLQPGGVLALLGRNGAGKTTCISTIIGFLRPKNGEIRLFGEPIHGLSPERISMDPVTQIEAPPCIHVSPGQVSLPGSPLPGMV